MKCNKDDCKSTKFKPPNGAQLDKVLMLYLFLPDKIVDEMLLEPMNRYSKDYLGENDGRVVTRKHIYYFYFGIVKLPAKHHYLSYGGIWSETPASSKDAMELLQIHLWHLHCAELEGEITWRRKRIL